VVYSGFGSLSFVAVVREAGQEAENVNRCYLFETQSNWRRVRESKALALSLLRPWRSAKTCLAGVTFHSTATHGSGRTGGLSSFVRRMELFVDEKIWILDQDHDRDLFCACNVGLG
jgi:hypothetical protein